MHPPNNSIICCAAAQTLFSDADLSPWKRLNVKLWAIWHTSKALNNTRRWIIFSNSCFLPSLWTICGTSIHLPFTSIKYICSLWNMEFFLDCFAFLTESAKLLLYFLYSSLQHLVCLFLLQLRGNASKLGRLSPLVSHWGQTSALGKPHTVYVWSHLGNILTLYVWSHLSSRYYPLVTLPTASFLINNFLKNLLKKIPRYLSPFFQGIQG